MEDLFVKQPQFEKTSSTNLSGDPAQWTKEIISYFHEEFPQLAHLPAKLTFTQKDDSKGYAIGAITVGHNNISVPVVVQDFYLKDMDVAVAGGNLVPLTEESVGMLFTRESAFSQAVPPEDVNQTIRLFSKDLHVPWSIDKYSSAIEAVSAGITKKAQQEFLDEIEASPELKESFINNDTYSVIEKIAALKCDDAIADEELLEKTLPRDIYTIEKTGRFEYTAFLGNSDIDNKVSIPLQESDVKEAYETLEKSAAVKEYKDFTLASKIASEAPIVDFDGKKTDLTIHADDVGNYHVKEAGVSTQTTPSGNFVIKMPAKMPSTAITKASTGEAKPKADGSVKLAEYRKDDFGVFLLENGTTRPVYLEKVSNINNVIDIEAFDGLGMVKISMWDGIKSPTFDEEKDTYFLPKGTDFVKLGSLKENLYEFPEDQPSGDWVMNIDGKSYAFGGVTFDKYAKLGHSLNDVGPTDAKWYMVQMGTSPQEMEKIALKEGERYYFSSKLSCPRPFSEYVEEWNEKLAAATTLVDDKLLNMVKHAAVIPDNLTVDSVLSLRFLNKKNVGEFFGILPVYEQVIMSLARLLLGVRVGLESVPEQAVKEAMENLTIVTAKLHELQTLTKKTKK
jgi:hypothetical protein